LQENVSIGPAKNEEQALVPWILGLAGLVPFGGLTLALLTGRTFGAAPEAVSLALAAYAATIASFLGGIRWGLAIRETQQRGRAVGDYVLSVLPQLLAWSAFALPDRQRLVFLGVLIIATGPLDLGLVRRRVAPIWFGRLRMVLSLVAGTALLLAASA
jgi:hypothetical protein